MIVSAYFASNGIPAGGLTPAAYISDTDDNLVVNGAAMSALTLTGFYVYDFAAFDSTKSYVIICDGGATLVGSERYAVSSTGEAGSIEDIDTDVTALQVDVTFLKDIEGGRWRMINNQMIFYKSDNVTEVARFNLKDLAGNLAMSGIFSRERV